MSRLQWRELDAEKWVGVLLAITTTLFACFAVWTLAVGVIREVVLLGPALLMALFAFLSGRLTRAWNRRKAWPWWFLTVVTGVALVAELGALLTGDTSWRVLAGIAVEVGLLLLLAHPRSRARIQPEYV